MRIIFIMSLVLYSLLNGHAYAQTADSSTQSRPSDANSYCQKLIGSADANKYASKYAEVIDKFRELNTVSGQRPRDPEIVKVINQVRQAYYLGMDDDSRSNAKGLIKLINKAVPREDSYNQDNFLIRYLPWLSGCASKLIDSPLRYIFFDPTIGREVLKSFKEADTARQSEILMEIWDAPSLGGLYDKRVQEKTGLPNIGINPHWVTPFLFAVDVPDLKPEAVQSIGRLDSIISQLNLKIQMVKLDVQRESAKKEAAEIAQREAAEKVQREAAERNRKKEEQAKASKAAEEEAATKRRAEAAAYDASPEGQLLYSYQHFQIVKHCHDMRKGLAVQFVNANEMADYSSKMKQIEGKLKGALKAGSTDRLWEIAEKNNRKFGGALIDGVLVGSMDYFEVLTNNNKTNWMSAKGDCDIQSEAFRGMIKSVLGNAPVKKSF